jgi:hypothetical protein
MYLENIDRLPQSTLSVMSSLIYSIQRERLVAAKSRIPQFTFDGKSFNSSVFSSIFLDVEYHQWKKMPTNIRTLFRPIGLAMPTLAVIGELAFARKGLANGKKIGTQLEGWTHMFNSLVNNQNQWLISFRKYYAILYAVASMSKYNSSLGVQQKMMRELLESCAFPTLKSKDMGIQKSLLFDIFGRDGAEGGRTHAAAAPAITSLRKDIKVTADKSGLYVGEEFISKAVDFHDMFMKQPCLALSGNPMAGKSSILRTVIDKINSHNLEERAINVMYCNLDSVDFKDIFGQPSQGKISFKASGIIPEAFKELIRTTTLSGSTSQQITACLVLDGSIGNEILERFTLEADHRLGISLDSGEKLILPSSCRIVIETSRIVNWSPSSLSQCPILYIPETMVGCRDIMQKELDTFPQKLDPHRDLFLAVFDVVIIPAIEFSKTLTSNIQSVEKAHVKHACTLIKGLYEDFGDLGYDRLITFEQHHWIFSTVIFAVIWTFGSFSTISDQGMISRFLHYSCFRRIPAKIAYC